jgi:ABC-type nitrate/sulfonate/bicarbonate transport system substrate-binding protein
MSVLSKVTFASIALLATGGADAAERTLKVRMDYLFQGYQAPFFVALDKGYYRASGLNVDLLIGQTSGVGLRTVSSGTEELGFLDVYGAWDFKGCAGAGRRRDRAEEPDCRGLAQSQPG